MWIVRLALDRPYTFIVLALLILILSPLVILRTPTDIFPNINIPVVAVVWNYTGLNPEEMEGRITSVYERTLTTPVDNIEHIESTTINGLAIVKIYLQPNASLDTANAQITAISQIMLRQMPPGTQPPLILNFSASSVPISSLVCPERACPSSSSTTRREFPAHAARHGSGRGRSLSLWRQTAPDDDQSEIRTCFSRRDCRRPMCSMRSPTKSGSALGHGEDRPISNTTSTSMARHGTSEELNDLPIKIVGGSTIYLRDVATVSDGFAPQTNIVRQDGQRGVLVSILKAGTASTIDVVDGIRDDPAAHCPDLAAALKHQAVRRSVDLRERRRRERGPRSHHRGRPDGA